MSFAPPPNAWNFVARGVASAVAASGGTSNSTRLKNTSGGDFYIRRLKAVAYFNAATGSGLAGTPFNSVPSPTIGSNTNAPATLVVINVKIGQTSWFSQEVSVFELMGPDGDGYWFDLVLPMLKSDEEAIVSVINNSTVVADVAVSLHGYAVPRGTPGIVQV